MQKNLCADMKSAEFIFLFRYFTGVYFSGTNKQIICGKSSEMSRSDSIKKINICFPVFSSVGVKEIILTHEWLFLRCFRDQNIYS